MSKGRLIDIERFKSRLTRKHPLIEPVTNVVPIRDRQSGTVTAVITVVVDIHPDQVPAMVSTIETATEQWNPQVTLRVARY